MVTDTSKANDLTIKHKKYINGTTLLTFICENIQTIAKALQPNPTNHTNPATFR